MRYKIHVSSGEFCFVEYETDSFEDAISEHDRVRNAFLDREGHNQLEWARVRNNYLHTGEIEIEDLEKCNKSQRFVINEFKLAIRSVNKE